MHLLKHLLQPKSSNRRRSTRTQSNNFALETLEPRIAFDASGLEGPTLEPISDTPIKDSGDIERLASEFCSVGCSGRFTSILRQ